MVTNVEMVSVNIRIRRWGFSRFRIMLMTMFEQMSTKSTLAPIVSAASRLVVTASVGHMPRSNANTGFSFQIPAKNVLPNDIFLSLAIYKSSFSFKIVFTCSMYVLNIVTTASLVIVAPLIAIISALIFLKSPILCPVTESSS